MNNETRERIEQLVWKRLVEIGIRRAEAMEELHLNHLLSLVPPYGLQFEHAASVSDLLKSLSHRYDADMANRLLGRLLCELAVEAADRGCVSSLKGIDIDLQRDGVRYLISVKSGKNWGNSTQHKKQRENFATAVRVLRQNKASGELQPTLGICYGKFKTVNNGVYLHIGGQSFWELISSEPDLYKDIIEPIGYKAREFNEEFEEKKAQAINRMTRDFSNRFCTESGAIDWPRVVELVSRNMDSAPLTL